MIAPSAHHAITESFHLGFLPIEGRPRAHRRYGATARKWLVHDRNQIEADHRCYAPFHRRNTARTDPAGPRSLNGEECPAVPLRNSSTLPTAFLFREYMGTHK